MIRDGLYHYVTGLPKVQLPRYIALIYGRHAEEQMKKDRYGVITAPLSLDVSNAKIIEMAICHGYVSKIVARVSYSPKCDLCLVVNPEDGFVRTLWLNKTSDKHKSLDRSRYIILNP